METELSRGSIVQNCQESRSVQESIRRVGRRRCLLKGCDCDFRPNHALSRYCSAACVAAAKRWRQCEANRRYRSSSGGKSKRQAQSCRYRRRQRSCGETTSAPASGCEGYRYSAGSKKTRCLRPGCYERFLRSSRSPFRKFCNADCRRALRRVLIREQRWREHWNQECSSAVLHHDSW